MRAFGAAALLLTAAAALSAQQPARPASAAQPPPPAAAIPGARETITPAQLAAAIDKLGTVEFAERMAAARTTRRADPSTGRRLFEGDATGDHTSDDFLPFV